MSPRVRIEYLTPGLKYIGRRVKRDRWDYKGRLHTPSAVRIAFYCRARRCYASSTRRGNCTNTSFFYSFYIFLNFLHLRLLAKISENPSRRRLRRPARVVDAVRCALHKSQWTCVLCRCTMSEVKRQYGVTAIEHRWISLKRYVYLQNQTQLVNTRTPW